MWIALALNSSTLKVKVDPRIMKLILRSSTSRHTYSVCVFGRLSCYTYTVLISVSYTHLDVYKRQVFGPVPGFLHWTGRDGDLSLSLSLSNLDTLQVEQDD